VPPPCGNNIAEAQALLSQILDDGIFSGPQASLHNR
jgi:hypothetical protein